MQKSYDISTVLNHRLNKYVTYEDSGEEYEENFKNFSPLLPNAEAEIFRIVYFLDSECEDHISLALLQHTMKRRNVKSSENLMKHDL